MRSQTSHLIHGKYNFECVWQHEYALCRSKQHSCDDFSECNLMTRIDNNAMGLQSGPLGSKSNIIHLALNSRNPHSADLSIPRRQPLGISFICADRLWAIPVDLSHWLSFVDARVLTLRVNPVIGLWQQLYLRQLMETQEAKWAASLNYDPLFGQLWAHSIIIGSLFDVTYADIFFLLVEKFLR